MSQSATRSTAFLQEMGIGVQWKLRHGGDPAASEADAFVTAVQALADGLPAQEAPPAAAPAPAPSARSASVPVSAPVSAPVSMPQSPPAQPPAAGSADADDTAWFDQAPVPASAPASAPHPAPPVVAPVSDAAIAAMDWPALRAAVSSCTRCTLCATRVAAVNGRGAERAAWIAIAAAPSPADEAALQAVAGEAGQLLHNMLKAIALKPETEVYITNVVKCRPPGRNPTGEEVIACRPYLERELALTGAATAITFGQFAARGMMMGPAARGKVMHYGASQLPVVATYHPDDLLRQPEDKAKAWADLCLAKASHG